LCNIVSKGGQVTEFGKGGQVVLKGYFKPLEKLKDYGNMVESDTRTNGM
jgi:hypothetical protein